MNGMVLVGMNIFTFYQKSVLSWRIYCCFRLRNFKINPSSKSELLFPFRFFLLPQPWPSLHSPHCFLWSACYPSWSERSFRNISTQSQMVFNVINRKSLRANLYSEGVGLKSRWLSRQPREKLWLQLWWDWKVDYLFNDSLPYCLLHGLTNTADLEWPSRLEVFQLQENFPSDHLWHCRAWYEGSCYV